MTEDGKEEYTTVGSSPWVQGCGSEHRSEAGSPDGAGPCYRCRRGPEGVSCCEATEPQVAACQGCLILHGHSSCP
jgi:hypothetical protein